MKKTFLNFIIPITFLLHFSCKKNDIAPSNLDKLCDKTWTTYNIKITPKTNTSNMVVPICNADDVLCFKRNQTLYFDEGGDKCSTDDMQEYASWSFNNDETKIFVRNLDTLITYNIIQNDGNMLILSQKIVSDNITYTITTSYTK